MGYAHGPTPCPSRVNAAARDAARAVGLSAREIRSRSMRPVAVRGRWIAWSILIGAGFGYAPTARAWGAHHTSIMDAHRQGWMKKGAAPVIGGGPLDYQPV